MLLFAILVIFCLASAFITWGLGAFVYAKNPSSSISRLFFATMLAATYWAVGEFFIWYPGGYDGISFWLKASSFWPVVIAMTVHFIYSFTRNSPARQKKFPVLLTALYLPALFFSLVGLLTDMTYTVRFQPGTGFIYLPVQDTTAYLAETAYILAIILWAGYTSFSAWRHAGPGKIRRQNLLVAAGLVNVIGFGFLSGILLPAYGIFLPNLVFIGIVIFSLFIAYAVLRLGLFTLSPEAAVPDILRVMPDGLVLADMEDRILTTNASANAILCSGEHDPAGHSLAEYVPEPMAAVIHSTVRSQGVVSDLEVILDEKNYRVVSISGSLVRDPEGEPAGFVLIVRDITNRKKSEKALQAANEKIALLNRLNRHDLSNLVTALWTYLELLKETTIDPVRDSYVDSSLALVKRIDGLLQFSREYQDIGMDKPAWQSLHTVLLHAAGDIPRDGIEILIPDAPFEIYADPLVEKVVYNLFENAIRHGQHLTRIEATAAGQPGGELLVVIEDNGVGVPDEDKEKIFTYGFGKNTGMGLALSRDILSLTGIAISERGIAGTGARFEIVVPEGAWRAMLGY